MKAYTNTIPGTQVTFAMVPIPGGEFVMGSPDNETGAQAGRRPAAQGEDLPVLDGPVRGDLERIRAVHVSG